MINDGDFITINKADGTTVQAELYSKIELENLGKYVLYKLDGEIYGAKYTVEGDQTKLDTNLTDQEKEALNTIFQSMEVEA